jgi:hypothetical protein
MLGEGGRIGPGGIFGADLFLFDKFRPPWLELTRTFAVAGASGLGPTRGRARFRGIQEGDGGAAVRLPVRGDEGNGRVRVRFVTPTELKSEGEVRPEPDFGTLIHRLAERVWALGRLYQGWADWDYRDLLDMARMVSLSGWDWDHRNTTRRSSRTGQRHSIGGFRGWAEYEGPVGAFLPLLEIGRWIGVGRQTVWGKGEIRVEEIWLG